MSMSFARRATGESVAKGSVYSPPNTSHTASSYFPRKNPPSGALSAQARKLAWGRDVLYYPTRNRSAILACGALTEGYGGPEIFSFTRSADVAAEWATMPWDDDEGCGAILIFDRPSLKTRYRLYCGSLAVGSRAFCEEHVVARRVDIGLHLIGLVTESIAKLPAKVRAEVRARKIRVERCKTWSESRSRGEVEEVKALAQLRRAYPSLYDDLANGLAEIDNSTGFKPETSPSGVDRWPN
jgi:hypothetical protein